MRALSLILFLCTFWAVSSGHFTPLLLGAMAVSAVLVTVFCVRLRTVDAEGHPVHLLPRIAGFWLWLVPRIVRANLTVARLVFARRTAWTPRLVDVDCTQREDLGRTIVANCVTLTPGTVVVAVGGDSMRIHTIGPGDAAAGAAAIDRRVRAVMTDGVAR